MLLRTSRSITLSLRFVSVTPSMRLKLSASGDWRSSKRTRLNACLVRASTVEVWISSPSRIMPTRSQTASTSGKMCDEKKTVRPSSLTSLHQIHHGLLYQRIEATCWLIQNEQVRFAHERSNQPNFLLVATRVLLHFARWIKLKPLIQRPAEWLVNLRAVDACEQVEELLASLVRIEAEFAREIANALANCAPLCLGSPCRKLSALNLSMVESHQAAHAASSICLHHWGRENQKPRPPQPQALHLLMPRCLP